MSAQAINNIRIADFSWVIAGPMVTKVLAGMGAEVIKVESHVRQEFVNRDPLFEIVNNSKKSLALDLGVEEGRRIARELIATSDIIIENFSKDVMQRWGLDYASVYEINPSVIYVCGSGVGREGPLSDVLAYGSLLEAYSGRSMLFSEGDINPSLEGMGILPAWTDPSTAMWQTLAILSALHQREETGTGCCIDISMVECTISQMAHALIAQQVGDEFAPEDRDPPATCGGRFKCAGDDEWLLLNIHNDDEWAIFCIIAGCELLAKDVRFKDRESRHENAHELVRSIDEILCDISGREIEPLLLAQGLDCSLARNPADVFKDTLLQSRGVIQVEGLSHATTAMPWRSQNGRSVQFGPAPRLGEHSRAVLAGVLGKSEDEIAELYACGAIYVPDLVERLEGAAR